MHQPGDNQLNVEQKRGKWRLETHRMSRARNLCFFFSLYIWLSGFFFSLCVYNEDTGEKENNNNNNRRPFQFNQT